MKLKLSINLIQRLKDCCKEKYSNQMNLMKDTIHYNLNSLHCRKNHEQPYMKLKQSINQIQKQKGN